MDNSDSDSDSSGNENIPIEDNWPGPSHLSGDVDTAPPIPFLSTEPEVDSHPRMCHRRIQEMISEHRRAQTMERLTQAGEQREAVLHVPQLQDYFHMDVYPEHLDYPASGDTRSTRTDVIEIPHRDHAHAQAMRGIILPIVSVSSGYLGSNESSSEGSSTSTSTVTSVASELETRGINNDNEIVGTSDTDINSVNSESLSVAEATNPVEHQNVQNSDDSQMESTSLSQTPDSESLGVESTNLDDPGTSQPEVEIEEQTSMSKVITVNAANPENDWPWDQRNLRTPASMVDVSEAEYGPDMISYMQKLVSSPSEEMFSRPASNSNSATKVPPTKPTRPLFRSISCPTLSVLGNELKYGTISKSDPNILYHQIFLDRSIVEIKRSRSIDSLKHYLRQSNSKGDYLKVAANGVHMKFKPEESDSGEDTPNGSSVRSRRIDNLLCSLFALCVSGKQPKEKESTVSLTVDTFDETDKGVSEEIRKDSIPRAAMPDNARNGQLIAGTEIISENIHKDNVDDILDFVQRVAASNNGPSEPNQFYSTGVNYSSNANNEETSTSVSVDTVDASKNLERPWKRNGSIIPKTSKQTVTSERRDLPNIAKCRTAYPSSDNYLTVEKKSSSKFVVDLKADRFAPEDFCVKSGVRALYEMDPKKSKSVKFEDSEKKKLVVNRNSESNLSSSQSDESVVTITPYPPKFRVSNEFSKKEERIRPNSLERESPDELESKTRRRCVNFEDSCPERRLTRYHRSPSAENVSADDDSKGKSDISLNRKCSNLVISVTSELFQVKGELADRSNLIDNSVEALEQLLTNLQNLWLNVNEGGKIPTLPETTGGEHRLAQLTNLCCFIVKEMESDWQSCISAPFETQKLIKLEESNRYLKEQLESCRVIQGCLESEINYVAKEKVLLNEEVKHLSLHLAKLESSLRTPPASAKKDMAVGIGTSRPFYSPKPRTRTVSQQSSQDSIGFCVTITEADCDSIDKGTTTDADVNGNNVQKREDEFNTIMDFFRERGSDFNYYQTQLDKYDDEVSTLKRQVEITAAERAEMKHAYDTLSQEHRDLVRERGHYEGVLKIILQEKQTNEHSLQDLMEILIQKLNAMSEDGSAGANSSRVTLLEGALQAVQEQNVNYREEVEILKQRLAEGQEFSETEKSELEASLAEAVQKAGELETNLSEKTEILSEYQKNQQEKLKKMEDVRLVITQAKTQLEKALLAKEEEIKKIQETMENLQKNGLRQQKKISELQKVNSRLTRDIVEQKHNLEALNNIVHQLRSNLKEQKVQWAERIKSSGDEAKQTKDHCKWLQAQIEHLNGQLKDAHERMKGHEKDKSTLAQQVLAAEEERKVIDRRFQELRTAMAGDLVLRQALAERNEALTSEITRMRRQKLLKMGSKIVSDEMKEELAVYNAPPSEMSTVDTMSSLNSISPAAIYHTEGDKGLPMRNRYIAVAATYGNVHGHNHSHRRTNAIESPRNAVSMHVPGVSTHGNRN